MILWITDIFDRLNSTATAASDTVCAYLEWYSHSDDIKPFRGSGTWQAQPPLFQDDDGDYCDEYDVYLDEYDWESNNDLSRKSL